MNDDELGRLLGDAFSADARRQVGDHVLPPDPRFARDVPTVRRRARLLLPLVAAAAVVLAVAVAVALSAGRGARGPAAAATSAPAFGPPSSPAGAVDVRFVNRTGEQVGVGMPVIARFSAPITDARALAARTVVRVDGRPVDAAWYFERSPGDAAYPVEGHLRTRGYWPAHATVRVDVHARGVAAGGGLRFADDLRLTFRTGPAVIAVVDDATHRMTVSRDGRPVASYPVSLGSSRTPTLSGVKVIMDKAPSVCMHDAAGTYYECGIADAQRLTYSGEFLHAAPWNMANIGRRNTSNGCTNLRPADAQALYAALEVGDVVVYPSTGGPPMRLDSGYGDWDIPWRTWLTGGLVPTR